MKHKTVLQDVFDGFMDKLRESGKVDSAVTDRLQDLLKRRDLKAESIRKALFPEENVS